jgi:hypothetical protein
VPPCRAAARKKDVASGDAVRYGIRDALVTLRAARGLLLVQ